MPPVSSGGFCTGGMRAPPVTVGASGRRALRRWPQFEAEPGQIPRTRRQVSKASGQLQWALVAGELHIAAAAHWAGAAGRHRTLPIQCPGGGARIELLIVQQRLELERE